MASCSPTLSVSLDAYEGYEMPLALASLAGLGVTRVEPAFSCASERQDKAICATASVRRMTSWLRDTGLTCSSLSVNVDVLGPDARDQLPRWLDCAADLGAQVLLVPGVRRRHVRRALTLLAAISDRVSERGITVALTPNNDAGALALPETADLVRAAQLPWLGLGFRTAHAVVSQPGLRVADQFDAVSTDCRHLHLGDLRVHNGWFPVATGEGAADCDRVLHALLDHPMPLTLELPLRQHQTRSGQLRQSPYRVPLSDIESAITQSLRFISDHLPVSFFH